MPNIGVGMEDPGLGNIEPVNAGQSWPRPTFSSALAAAANLAEPEPLHSFVELLESVVVSRYRIILSPTANHTGQPASGFIQRSVAAADKVFLDRGQRAAHTVRHRDPNKLETL